MGDMAKDKGHKGMLDRMDFLKQRDKARQKAKDSDRNIKRIKKQHNIKRSLAADVEGQRDGLIEGIINAILEMNQEQKDYRSVMKKKASGRKDAKKAAAIAAMKERHMAFKDFKKHSGSK